MAREGGEGPAAEGPAAGRTSQEAGGAADQGRKTTSSFGGQTEAKTGEEQSMYGGECNVVKILKFIT